MPPAPKGGGITNGSNHRNIQIILKTFLAHFYQTGSAWFIDDQDQYRDDDIVHWWLCTNGLGDSFLTDFFLFKKKNEFYLTIDIMLRNCTKFLVNSILTDQYFWSVHQPSVSRYPPPADIWYDVCTRYGCDGPAALWYTWWRYDELRGSQQRPMDHPADR